MFDLYILNYELGEHHTTVEVTEHDFKRVCDELKKEFEIFQTYDVINTDPVAYESIFYIINYHGYLQRIGRRYWYKQD